MIARVNSPIASVPVSERDSPLFANFWFMLLSAFADRLNRLIGAQMVQSAQADLAALASTLKSGDAGLLVEVTDYAHILRWTGSAWEWGPGESGGGEIRAFAVDPTGAGWQLCDGTAVDYLLSDGTTDSYTTPDLVSASTEAAYLKLGDPVSGPNAAVAPTFTGGAIGSAATGITAATTAETGSTTVTSPAGATLVATAAHTHTVTITDPHHTHTLGSSSVADDGEPRNMILRPFFRR